MSDSDKVLDWYERRTSFVLVMEKPQNSIDLFEFSRTFGAIKEEPAKIIMKQVLTINHQICSTLFRSSIIVWNCEKSQKFCIEI